MTASDPDPLLAAALDYAGRGWPVLPLHGARPDGTCTCGDADCASPAKHPRTRTGLKEATTDADLIKSWWRRWPDSNVGLLTGVAFDVLDCDDPSHMAWFDLAGEHNFDPDAPMVVTGKGGLHIYFAPTGAGNRARFADDLDWRGANGYVVAPPSRHASGREYAWL